MNAPTTPPSRVRGGLCAGPIPRRERISVREFFHEYYRPGRAVILGDLAEGWPAMRKWTFEFFREHYSHVPLTCGFCFDRSVQQTLAQYLDYIEDLRARPRDEPSQRPPLAMEGWYFRYANAELERDYTVPPVFADDWLERYAPKRWNPKATTIILGPRGTFTKLHRDLHCFHGWNTQIWGSKRWLVIPPEHAPDVYLETRQSSGYFPGTDVDAPDFQRYPRLANVRYYEGVLEPGDTIFFPCGWLHQVHGLQDSISLHHNYVSGNNWLAALSTFVRYRLGRKAR